MVTVIIPTYKRAKYIERAIESVLNQTYKDYEIIVVDDNDENSEDRKNMEKIMQKYQKLDNFIYAKHKKNMNGAAARNTGIKLAKGEYITFLDDDDFFLKNRLEILVKEMEENIEYDAIYSSCVFIKGKEIIGYIEAEKNGNLEEEILMQKSFFGTGSNMFFRKEAMNEVGEFDKSFIRHQDFEYMVRFFEKNKKILAVNKVLVIKSNDDIINRPNLEKAIQLREKYLKRFAKNIEKYDKNTIFAKNYTDLLIIAIQNFDISNYKKIKKDIQKYTTITLKQKIYFSLILLNSFKIIQILRKPLKIINKRKLLKKVENEVIEEIKFIREK